MTINKRVKALLVVGLLVFVTLGLLILVFPKQTSHDVPAATATITISKDGFMPAHLRIRIGTEIIWTNSDSKPHQVASDPFPDHTDLPELNSVQSIGQGGSYKFTFNKTGAFGYHDLLNPQFGGTIEVVK